MYFPDSILYYLSPLFIMYSELCFNSNKQREDFNSELNRISHTHYPWAYSQVGGPPPDLALTPSNHFLSRLHFSG